MNSILLVMKNILLVLLILTSLVGHSQVPGISLSIKDGIQDKVLKQRIESNTTKLLQRINEAYKKGSETLLLDEKGISASGYKAVAELWKDGHFYCSAEMISENVLQKKNSYQIRNIPCVFGENEKFDIVLEYLPDGRINDFYIGLEAHQFKSVLAGTDTVDQARREIILGFLENLRTSYVKKDINYIGALYSEKALIITGKILKTQDFPTDQIHKSFTKNQVEYLVVSKGQYLERLRNVFNSIQYLRLDFKSIEVVKHRKHPNFYGILLQQTWDSSKYKDDGWLFLLVQFKDNEDPLIWVRTWQDAKDTPASDVFGFHNFTIEGEKQIK